MLNDSVIMALGMSCRPILITPCNSVSVALVEVLWLLVKDKFALCLHTSECAKWKTQITGEESVGTHTRSRSSEQMLLMLKLWYDVMGRGLPISK